MLNRGYYTIAFWGCILHHGAHLFECRVVAPNIAEACGDWAKARRPRVRERLSTRWKASTESVFTKLLSSTNERFRIRMHSQTAVPTPLWFTQQLSRFNKKMPNVLLICNADHSNGPFHATPERSPGTLRLSANCFAVEMVLLTSPCAWGGNEGGHD